MEMESLSIVEILEIVEMKKAATYITAYAVQSVFFM